MKRLDLSFDPGVPSEAKMYAILKKLKKGNRAHVLAVTVINYLTEKTVPINASADFAASVLEAFASSEAVPGSSPPVDVNIPASVNTTKQRDKTEKPKKASPSKSVPLLPVDRNSKPTVAEPVQEKSPIAPPLQEKSVGEIEYLTEDEYIDKCIEIGQQYILEHYVTSPDQAEGLKTQWQTIRAVGDIDELYSLVVDDCPMLSQPGNELPEGYGSIKEYCEDQLKKQGYQRIDKEGALS